MLPKLSGAALALALVFSHPANTATTDPDLATVKAATARFQDVKQAIAEGYVRDPMDVCDTAEMMGKPASLGGMGVHYFRPDLLGIKGPPNPRVNGSGTHTDFRTPSVLIYEPQADGSLQLVAVENLVFRWAWNQAGNKEPPTYLGIPYDLMQDDPHTKVDEAHMFEPHYDRHVWLFRYNPNGTFAQFNPRVSCKAHKTSVAAGGMPGHAHSGGR